MGYFARAGLFYITKDLKYRKPEIRQIVGEEIITIIIKINQIKLILKD